MDELNNQEVNLDQQPVEEQELSHTDKLTGIITEPSNTFTQMAKFPPRTIDWLLPFFITLILTVISTFIIMNNPIIKSDFIEKQRKQTEEKLDKLVAEGKLSQEQADTQIESVESFIGSPVIMAVGKFVGTLIFFFLVALIYFLLARYLLKGSGNYASTLVSMGLSSYIGIMQILIITIASIMLDRLFIGTSVADFLGLERTTLPGFLLGLLDPLFIWSIVVLSIGLAKMFHSAKTGKYYAVGFGVSILFQIIIFALS